MKTLRSGALFLLLWTFAAGCGADDSGNDDGAGGAGGSTGGAAGSSGKSSATGGSPASGGTNDAMGGSAGSGATSGGGGAGNEAGTGEPGDVDCYADGDGTTTLAFVNRCGEAVTFRGSDIDGGNIAAGAFVCVDIGTDIEELSAKRYWGFVGADPGAEHHTLAEFTFNTDFNDFDWYNISHVDAFNLPMRIAPLARPDCDTLTCAGDLLADCPEVGRYLDAEGTLVACVSPERDDASSPVALHFESCDEAYAWSGDDQNGDDPSPVRACAGEDWEITFCPEP